MSFKKLDLLLRSGPGAPGAQAPVADEPAADDESLPLVLVIDDDMSVRRALQALLSPTYRLRMHATATEGVAAFGSDVTAVVLDVKMKGRDGFWAADEIRKREPLVPIIFFSAFQDAKNPYDIINEHRPFAYVMKDGDPGRLLSSLGNATSHYRMVQVSRRLSARFGKTFPGSGSSK